MSETPPTLNDIAAHYSTLELFGFATSALVAALLCVIAVYRIIRTVHAVRNYDAACEKVRTIEETLTQMQSALDNLDREYEKNLVSLKEQYSNENFSLQQVIFERNSEILELKNKLMEHRKTEHV